MSCPFGRLSRVADFQISKELALTRADLLRLLPVLSRKKSCNISGNGIEITDQEFSIVITIIEKPELKIGALALPRLRLDFHFTGDSRQPLDDFLRQFERVYQRGGG